jgi:hypothetical protein
MAGNYLKGSEKVWEAAAHAVMEAARQRGWPSSDHRELHMASRRFAEETGDESIADGFAIAEKFRANSEFDFMEDFDYDDDRQIVRRLVNRVLALN